MSNYIQKLKRAREEIVERDSAGRSDEGMCDLHRSMWKKYTRRNGYLLGSPTRSLAYYWALTIKTPNLSIWTYFSIKVLRYLEGRIREGHHFAPKSERHTIDRQNQRGAPLSANEHFPTTYHPHLICKTKAIIGMYFDGCFYFLYHCLFSFIYI